MSPENSQEHIFCVKNAHGLENGVYSDPVNLLPAEKSPQRWMPPTKILLKIPIFPEISPEGSMLAAGAWYDSTWVAPTISRRFPRFSLTNYCFFSLNVFRRLFPSRDTKMCDNFFILDPKFHASRKRFGEFRTLLVQELTALALLLCTEKTFATYSVCNVMEGVHQRWKKIISAFWTGEQAHLPVL